VMAASTRSPPARNLGRRARAVSRALVAVLLVASGPAAWPHGATDGGIAAPYRRGRLARSISTHQIRRDARAALVQRLHKASDSRIELCRLFPMNEPARPWDLRSFLETLHS